MARSNADGTDHEADVTVQLLDASRDTILEETQSTGTITSGGATWSDTVTVEQADLVTDYQETDVVVQQTS